MPIRKHWFLVSLVLVVAVALSLGRNIDQTGWGPILRNSAVFLIFLGTGYSLNSRRILMDVARVHHHLGVQLFIFLIVPILVLLPAYLLRGTLTEPAVWVGLAAVAVLPTTISSCIAFTQVAGGNVPLAMLNSALSNALGIVVSPLLLSILIGLAPQAVEAGGVTSPAVTGGALLLGREATLSIFGSLARLMLAPAAIGQALRILLTRRRGYTAAGPGSTAPETGQARGSTAAEAGHAGAPGEGRVRPLNSVLILLIVFLTLAAATAERGLLSTAGEFLPVVGYLALLHLVILLAATLTGRLLSRDPRDRVAILFTASQKTLAFGAPMLTLYFADSPGRLASAMLPLIFYHLWQLVVAGVVESFYRVTSATKE
jgi:sodium/bile acid cotransporter 7